MAVRDRDAEQALAARGVFWLPLPAWCDTRFQFVERDAAGEPADVSPGQSNEPGIDCGPIPSEARQEVRRRREGIPTLQQDAGGKRRCPEGGLGNDCGRRTLRVAEEDLHLREQSA